MKQGPPHHSLKLAGRAARLEWFRALLSRSFRKQTKERPGKYEKTLFSQVRKLLNACEVLASWDTGSYGTQKNQSPVLMITGEDDIIIPPWTLRKFAEGIDNSEVRVIPDCRHVSIVWQPEKVADLIIDFAEQKVSLSSRQNTGLNNPEDPEPDKQ